MSNINIFGDRVESIPHINELHRSMGRSVIGLKRRLPSKFSTNSSRTESIQLLFASAPSIYTNPHSCSLNTKQ